MRFRAIPALFWFAFILIPALAMPSPAHADDWLPISQEDLAMKDNPKHNGDHAMILWREVVDDDAACRESYYVRIKIFDDVGKAYGDVQTEPYDPSHFKVKDIQARTIHPDGSILPFEGKVFDKVVLKYRSERLVAKSFTLPGIVPGSIIEFKYTFTWDLGAMYSAHWQVQSELYQRKVHFAFRPLPFLTSRWSNTGLPSGHVPVIQHDSKGTLVTLDIEDMPGYETEVFMPPENEVRAKVEFFYSSRALSANAFWEETGQEWEHWVEGYINKQDAVQHELASLISSLDTRPVKLRKIYDRVQSFGNLSYAPEQTTKETRRENKNVGDVLSNRYGWHDQLSRTFVALAQGAGFDATLVVVPSRDRAFFDKNYLSITQLRAEIVLVREGGKELYLDPGTRFCPFGVVPWEFTSDMGIRLDKKSSALVTVPAPAADDATISRKATLKLNENGSVQGAIEVTFTGQEAMGLRLEERDQDDAGRKTRMEDLLRNWLPANSTVMLQNVNDWESSKDSLIAAYQVTVPGYATAVGHRMLLPWSLFEGAHRNPFQTEHRVNPIAFSYPYLYSDDVTISLPSGFQIESVPAPKSLKNGVSEFSADFKSDGANVLHATRKFRLNKIFIDAKYYAALRSFFGQVEATDGEQALLKITAN